MCIEHSSIILEQTVLLLCSTPFRLLGDNDSSRLQAIVHVLTISRKRCTHQQHTCVPFVLVFLKIQICPRWIIDKNLLCVPWYSIEDTNSATVLYFSNTFLWIQSRIKSGAKKIGICVQQAHFSGRGQHCKSNPVSFSPCSAVLEGKAKQVRFELKQDECARIGKNVACFCIACYYTARSNVEKHIGCSTRTNGNANCYLHES